MQAADDERIRALFAQAAIVGRELRDLALLWRAVTEPSPLRPHVLEIGRQASVLAQLAYDLTDVELAPSDTDLVLDVLAARPLAEQRR
jgi:hypothetical protein